MKVNVLVKISEPLVKQFHHTYQIVRFQRTKRPVHIPIHLSQKPEEPHDINLDTIGLNYPVVNNRNPVIEHFHWTPKPDSLPNLPFAIDRAGVAGNLPVYTDYKGGGTKIVTILRKCKGDIDALKIEVEKVVGKEARLRPGGVVIDGNYRKRLKVWLTGLGF